MADLQAADRRAVLPPRTPPALPWRPVACVLVGLLLSVALAGCSDFSLPTARPAFTLNVSSDSLSVGQTLQLRVNGGSGTIFWSSSDTTVATVNLGKVTAVGSGTATIRAVSGGRQVSVKITVVLPAAIGLSSTSVTFNGVAGATIPDSQTVDVTNVGQSPLTGLALGTISYSAGATGWLAASLTQTAAPSKLVVRPNTTSLAPGSYSATVQISSPVAANGPLTVTVTFVVISQASIVLGSSTATFNGQQGATTLPSAQQIAITNGGAAPLTGLGLGTITYSAGATGWLNASVSPANAPSTLTLQPNTQALTPGDYTATVPVTSTIAGVAPASVTVTYHVAQAPTPPVIVLSTSSLTFNATRTLGLPPSQTVNISNGGQVALTGLSVSIAYVGPTTGWLNASLNSTSAPATLTAQPNNQTLAAGTYTATITVSTSISGVTSKTVTVTYVVADPPIIGLSSTSAGFSTTSATNPSAQVINVSNSGGGTLNGLTANITYGAGQLTGWLSASVASTAPNSPNSTPLTLSVSAGVVTPDSYSATVTLSSTAPGVVSQTVTIAFTRQATLAGDIQVPIFQTVGGPCSSCHLGATPTAGIGLDSKAASAASLINHQSPSGPEILVIPGDSVNSYLYKIVKGVARTGPPNTNMPFGCTSTGAPPCISPALQKLIGIWIAQGARQDP